MEVEVRRVHFVLLQASLRDSRYGAIFCYRIRVIIGLRIYYIDVQRMGHPLPMS
jgi:hypothetical protein